MKTQLDISLSETFMLCCSLLSTRACFGSFSIISYFTKNITITLPVVYGNMIVIIRMCVANCVGLRRFITLWFSPLWLSWWLSLLLNVCFWWGKKFVFILHFHFSMYFPICTIKTAFHTCYWNDSKVFFLNGKIIWINLLIWSYSNNSIFFEPGRCVNWFIGEGGLHAPL